MSKSFQKAFLNVTQARWESKYPFTPLKAEKSPKTKFLCDVNVERLGVYYIVSIVFSQNFTGKLTVDITVTRDINEQILDLPLDATPNAFKEGTYRVSRFWGKPDYWWKFKRDESHALLAMAGLDSSLYLDNEPQETCWTSKNYSLDESELINLILSDIEFRLDTFVLPVLEVNMS